MEDLRLLETCGFGVEQASDLLVRRASGSASAAAVTGRNIAARADSGKDWGEGERR